MPVKIDGGGYINSSYLGTANNIYTDGTGKVGIGTSTPTNLLEVAGSAANIYLRSNDSGDATLRYMGASSERATVRATAANNLLVETANLERFRIDGSGRVTMPYQPRFSGYRTAGTVASGNVYISNIADINVGSCYNTSTGIFTAPVAGDYFIGVFGLSYDSSSAAFQILKNSSLVTGFWPYQSSNVGNGANPCGFGLVSLAANDTLKINVAAGNIIGDTNYHNRTTIYLIG